MKHQMFGAAFAIVLAAGVLGPLSTRGQTTAPPLAPPPEAATHAIDPNVFATAHEVQSLDAALLRQVALAKGTLDLNLFGKSYNFSLMPVQDLAPGAKVLAIDADGIPAVTNLPLLDVMIFRGITHDRNLTSTFSLPGNWVMGEIRDGTEIIYLEPHYSRGNDTGPVETIVYRHSDLKPVSVATGGNATQGSATTTHAGHPLLPPLPQSSAARPVPGALPSPAALRLGTNATTPAPQVPSRPQGGGGGAGGQTDPSNSNSGYNFCAYEGEWCSFSGPQDVAYGANGHWTYKTNLYGGIACTNNSFGDPIPYTRKTCYIKSSQSGSDVPNGYTFCSNENEWCSFTGTRTVAYGAKGQFYYLSNVNGGISCDNANFGDPIPYTYKACYFEGAGTTVPTGPAGSTFCSYENQYCSFGGSKTVYYGANGQWASRTVSGGISCDNANFGDPIPYTYKACYYGGSQTLATGHLSVTVDWPYTQAYGGSTWTNQVRTVIAMVNAVYQSHGVAFQLDTMQYDGRLTERYNFDTAFSQYQNLHSYLEPGINFKPYFSGNDYDGCTFGLAAGSVFTMEQQVSDACHFGFGSAVSEQAYGVKHELGHNHNAWHDQADTWRDSNGVYHRSIMYSSIYGTIEDYFSNGSRCSCQNNSYYIDAYVQQFGS
ncbi:MAG TPA: M12 family metallo-peptidase [Candidatus Thermoplasmatota archaeon]|nr:M12 family metallo-peptidase [Candidatus Thermoplasmatota archaeon]